MSDIDRFERFIKRTGRLAESEGLGCQLIGDADVLYLPDHLGGRTRVVRIDASAPCVCDNDHHSTRYLTAAEHQGNPILGSECEIEDRFFVYTKGENAERTE